MLAQKKQNRSKPLLDALNGHVAEQIPFWYMRQAGRYLPEYMDLRQTAGSFLDLCYNPDFATKVTLQPLQRFDMDAAILFSDILVIPQALGQELTFVQGEGPKLPPINSLAQIEKLTLENSIEKLNPILKTVQQVSKELAEDKTLIGFSGAPWTVATYMVEGGSSRDFIKIKKLMYQQPQAFEKLLTKIVDATVLYLCAQIKSGADALQIFDSWSGVLDSGSFDRWVIQPTQEIVRRVKDVYPETPIIGFPKGAGSLYPAYFKETGVDAVSLDSNLCPKWAAENLQPLGCVQGNLDPVSLLIGGQQMLDRAGFILENLSSGPFIFNLGHGIIKETPTEHVAELSKFIKNFKKT